MKECPECKLTYLDSIEECHRCKIQLVTVKRSWCKDTMPLFIILIIPALIGGTFIYQHIKNQDYREGKHLIEKSERLMDDELGESNKYCSEAIRILEGIQPTSEDIVTLLGKGYKLQAKLAERRKEAVARQKEAMARRKEVMELTRTPKTKRSSDYEIYSYIEGRIWDLPPGTNSEDALIRQAARKFGISYRKAKDIYIKQVWLKMNRR